MIDFDRYFDQHLRINVEAFAASRRVRIDDDVPVSVSEGGVLRAAEICLGGSGAVVDSDDESWLGCDLRRLVVIEACLVKGT